jgi:hypothetical protein
MEGYTAREVEDARAARVAQAMLGHPTDRDFLGMVRSNMIDNCPVTESAVVNANRIFGPDLAGVRGRTVRRPPESVTTNHVQIPRVILERHQVVTLTVDVMFVNGVPFLVSASRGLNLISAEHTPSRTAPLLAGGIIQRAGGSRSDEGANTNARHGRIPSDNEGRSHEGREEKGSSPRSSTPTRGETSHALIFRVPSCTRTRTRTSR